MKRIKYTVLSLFALLIPMLVSAASFTFSPAIGTYNTNTTFTTSVFVTPGAGESISATKLSLTFPKDKLELISYTPVNGAPILAHVGTNANGAAGTIVDNIAFNPPITASTKVANVTFKTKVAGAAHVAVAPDAKLLDKSNKDRKVASAGGTYTVSAPVVKPPVQNNTQVKPKPKPKTTKKTTYKPKPKKRVVTPKPVKKPEKKEETPTTTDKTDISTTSSTTVTDIVVNNNTSQEAAVAGTGYNWPLWLAILILLSIGAYGFFIVGKKKSSDSR